MSADKGLAIFCGLNYLVYPIHMRERKLSRAYSLPPAKNFGIAPDKARQETFFGACFSIIFYAKLDEKASFLFR